MVVPNENPAPVEQREIKNYTPLLATKNRLMLYVSTGDSSVLKPTQTVPPEYTERLTPTMEYDISKQNFAIIEDASNRERLDKAGVAKKDIPEAVQKWAEKNALVIKKKKGDKALSRILNVTDTKDVTSETMTEFYNKYFIGPNNESNIRLFVADVVKNYAIGGDLNVLELKRDLNSIQTLSTAFGYTSGEIITQLIDAEVDLMRIPKATIDKIDMEINDVKADDKRLLEFLIEGQQIDAPKIIPAKPTATNPVATPLPGLSASSPPLGSPPGYVNVTTDKESSEQAKTVEQSDILKGDVVEIASHLFANPEHLDYTEDKIVKKTFANGKGGLMASIDGMGGQGLRHGEKAAEITQTELLKISPDEVPTLNQGFDLIDNALIESGKLVRDHIASLIDKDADTVVSGGIFCKSPNAGDEKKFFLAFNVGDARTYKYNSITGKVQQITVDGSLVNDLVRAGMLTPEQAKNHPRRNEVSKSVGGIKSSDDIDYYIQEVKEGDIFFSASDGLIDQYEDQELHDLIIKSAKNSIDPITNTIDLKTFSKTIATEARQVMIDNNSPLAKPDDINVIAMAYNESAIPVPTQETIQPELTGRELFDQYKQAVADFGQDKANIIKGKKLTSAYSEVTKFEDKNLPLILGTTFEEIQKAPEPKSQINETATLQEAYEIIKKDLIAYTQSTTKPKIEREEFIEHLKDFNMIMLNSLGKESEITNIDDLIEKHEELLDGKKSAPLPSNSLPPFEESFTSDFDNAPHPETEHKFAATSAEKFTPVNSYKDILEAIKTLKPPGVLSLSADSAGFTSILPQIITESLDQMIKKAKGKLYGVSLVKKPELIAINQKQIMTDLVFKAGIGPLGPQIKAHIELKNSSTNTDFETPVIKVDPSSYGDIDLQELADKYFASNTINKLIQQQLGEVIKDKAIIESVQIYFTDDNKVQLKIYTKEP